MSEKISIIIPAFNCQNTIEKTIKSVLNQSYKNLEIIIINDGSTDNTLDILIELEKIDKRIIVINQDNKGVSATRNKGIEVATGEYIAFVDADDILDKNMYLIMINKILKYDSDLCLCSYREIDKFNIEYKKFAWDDKVLYKEDINKILIPMMIMPLKGEQYIMGSVWRFICKSSIIKKVRFKENVSMAEDMLFCIEVYSLCNKLNTINECLYDYYRYSNTSMQRYVHNNMNKNYIYHEYLINLLKKYNLFDNNYERYFLNRLGMYTTSISNECRCKENKEFEKIQEIENILKEFSNDIYIKKGKLKNLKFDKFILVILFKFRFSKIIYLIFKFKEQRRKKLLANDYGI